MSSAANMSTPVTRGELKEELDHLRREFRHELDEATAPLATKAELAAAIAPLATKAELAAAIAPLATKAELAAAIAPLADRVQALERNLDLWGGALADRAQATERNLQQLAQGIAQLQIDLARHAGALQESMAAMISAVDDKHKDLPGRVKRLEDRAFRPRSR